MKKLYQRFFYVPKHAEVSARVFKTRTALSVLTILTCCVMFCSATFAWFTSAQSAGIEAITAASYSLDIAIDGESIGTCDSRNAVTYTCPLAVDDKHNVVITYAETATAETGYCVINGGDKTNSTEQINKGESLNLTVVAAKDEVITFSANWARIKALPSRRSAMRAAARSPTAAASKFPLRLMSFIPWPRV